MDPRTCYRLLVALPALTVLLAAPFALVYWNALLLFGVTGQAIDGSGEEMLVAAVLAPFAIPTALASVVVAAGSLWTLRGRDEDAHRRLAIRCPLWLGLATAGVTALIAVAMNATEGLLPTGAIVLGVASVLVGYAYLVSAAVLFALLRGLSIVRPRATPRLPSARG